MLVADDFPLVREALVAALGRQADLEVAGVASDGVEALNKARELHPDVVVLDLRMPGLSGQAVLARLREEMPDVRVLLLSASDAAEAVIDAVAAGAGGFVTKKITGDELVAAVRAVHRGEPVIDRELTAHLVRGLRRTDGPHRVTASESRLTQAEVNVLRLVAEGHSDKQIGAELSIAPRTVQSHLTQIRAKVGLRRRVELTRWAAENLL